MQNYDYISKEWHSYYRNIDLYTKINLFLNFKTYLTDILLYLCRNNRLIMINN